MSYSGVRLNFIIIIMVVISLLLVNRMFNYYINKNYTSLIDKNGLIEAFQSNDSSRLNEVRKKYQIEYELINSTKIVFKSDIGLPDVNPLIIDIKKTSGVLPYDYRFLLKKTKPNIILKNDGLSIVFSLSFENNRNKYIVFKRLIP